MLKKAKKTLLFTIIFTIIFSSVPVSFNAAIQYSLQYSYNDTNKTAEVVGFSGKGNVIVPRSVNGYRVVSVGTTFKNSLDLKSIVLPESVNALSEGAFSNCSNLLAVELLGDMETIPKNAFANCTSLSFIDFPDNLESISPYAFTNCSSLNEVDLPNCNVSVSRCAFYNCTGILKIIIPEKVKTIDMEAFQNCTGIQEVYYDAANCDMTAGQEYQGFESYYEAENFAEEYDFHNFFESEDYEGIKSYYFIGSVFENCKNFKTLHIGENVKIIPNCAFAYCPNLKTIYYNAKNCQIIENSIEYNKYYDGRIYDHYVIYTPAFMGCDNIETLVIGENVASIPENAFYGNNINSVEYNAKNCTVAGSEDNPVFNNVKTLKQFTIGANVLNIPENLFLETKDIENISVNSNNTLFNFSDGLLYTSDYKTLVWSVYSNKELKINANTSEISLSVKKTGTSFDNVSLDSSNKTFALDDGVIFTKDKSELVMFPNNKTEYTVPYGTRVIGESAFYNSSNLKNITLPDTLKEIKDNAFKLCKALSKIEVPDSVEKLGKASFENCKSLTKAKLGKNIRVIPEYCFNNDTSLSSVSYSDTINEIREYAFYNCPNFYLVKIPYFVKIVHENAFNSENLVVIYGHRNTIAQSYANRYGIEFSALDYPKMIKNDVNADNVVNISDATEIQSYLANVSDLSYDQKIVADINNDLCLNINDVTKLQLILAETV